MADVAEKVIQETVENATETLSGAKTPASPEGAAVAYGSLIIMAMLPIFFGALRSVKHQKDQKVFNISIVTSNGNSFGCRGTFQSLSQISISYECSYPICTK